MKVILKVIPYRDSENPTPSDVEFFRETEDSKKLIYITLEKPFRVIELTEDNFYTIFKTLV